MAKQTGFLSQILSFTAGIDPGVLIATGQGELHSVIFSKPNEALFNVKFYDGTNNTGTLLFHLQQNSTQASPASTLLLELQFSVGLFVEEVNAGNTPEFVVTYL